MDIVTSSWTPIAARGVVALLRRATALGMALSLAACSGNEGGEGTRDGGEDSQPPDAQPSDAGGEDAADDAGAHDANDVDRVDASPYDAGPPAAPEAITFADEDPREGFVEGTIAVTGAVDESKVDHYRVDWTDDAGTVAGKLLVVANRLGKLWLYRCALDGSSCIDSDISAGTPKSSGKWPRAAIDAQHGKVLVVESDTSLKPALYRCELDGTACTYREIPGSSVHPRLLVTQDELFVVASIFNVARCTLDGMSCTTLNLAPSPPYVVDPDIAISPAGDRLLLVGTDTIDHFQPILFRYALDGSLSASADISAGPGSGAGARPNALLDAKSNKLLVVTADDTFATDSYLLRCATDGTGCVSTVLPEISSTDFVIDTSADKLLVAGGSTPLLVRCETDGTHCAKTDISAGAPANVVSESSLVLDETNRKLLLAAHDTSTQALSIFRCNVDGTGCEYHPILVGGSNTGASPSAVIANGKLLVATIASGRFPTLYVCSLDASSCDLRGLVGSLPGSHLMRDPHALVFGTKLIVIALDVDQVTQVSHAALLRCDLDGTGCTNTPIDLTSSGLPLVDAAKQKLLVVSTDATQRLNLLRCELDGTGCKAALLEPPFPALAPSPVLDPVNHRLLVVATNLANLHRASLLTLDLW